MIIDRESADVVPVTGRTFDDFYASTARRTLSLAYALTGSWADAEDLVQDAYVAASRRWDTIGGYDDPSAWVRRLVLNRSVSRWRRLHREAAAMVRLSRRTDAQSSDADPVDPAFWAAVRRLPAQQARAITLFYIGDHSVEQIAELLGCSTGSVKTHLSRARAALAISLEGDAR